MHLRKSLLINIIFQSVAGGGLGIPTVRSDEQPAAWGGGRLPILLRKTE